MAIENSKSKTSTHVRVYKEKKDRVERVVRKQAFAEDRKVKETEIIDQILEEGLKKRERKLGIK
jgi:hypothetical protein